MKIKNFKKLIVTLTIISVVLLLCFIWIKVQVEENNYPSQLLFISDQINEIITKDYPKTNSIINIDSNIKGNCLEGKYPKGSILTFRRLFELDIPQKNIIIGNNIIVEINNYTNEKFSLELERHKDKTWIPVESNFILVSSVSDTIKAESLFDAYHFIGRIESFVLLSNKLNVGRYRVKPSLAQIDTLYSEFDIIEKVPAELILSEKVLNHLDTIVFKVKNNSNSSIFYPEINGLCWIEMVSFSVKNNKYSNPQILNSLLHSGFIEKEIPSKEEVFLKTFNPLPYLYPNKGKADYIAGANYLTKFSDYYGDTIGFSMSLYTRSYLWSEYPAEYIINSDTIKRASRDLLKQWNNIVK